MRDTKIELHKSSEYLSERECLQSKEATTTRFDKCICTWHFEKMLSPKGTKKHSKECFFSYLKKIYIPPNAKNSTPPTNAMVGKTFARIKAGLPFPLIFLCCLAKLIAFI